MKSFTEMKVYPKNWETLKSTVKKTCISKKVKKNY